MRPITDRQTEVLNYIIRFKEDHGYSPTFREISIGMGITIKGVSDHLQTLVKKGYISYNTNTSRTLIVLKLPESA